MLAYWRGIFIYPICFNADRLKSQISTEDKFFLSEGLTRPIVTRYISKAVKRNSEAEAAKATPRANYLHPEPRQLYSLKAD